MSHGIEQGKLFPFLATKTFNAAFDISSFVLCPDGRNVPLCVKLPLCLSREAGAAIGNPTCFIDDNKPPVFFVGRALIRPCDGLTSHSSFLSFPPLLISVPASNPTLLVNVARLPVSRSRFHAHYPNRRTMPAARTTTRIRATRNRNRSLVRPSSSFPASR